MDDTPGLTRREFLKNAGLILGATALGGAAMLSACSTDKTTSADTRNVRHDPVIQIKSTNQFAVTDTRDALARAFGQLCFDRSGGTIYPFYFPSEAIFKAREYWNALRNDAMDMTVMPLDYASTSVPELAIILLPGLVDSIDEGLSWANKPIGKAVDKLTLEYGVRHVLWAWTESAIGSKKHLIKLPADLAGDKINIKGPPAEYMFQQAGGQINTGTDSEIYSQLTIGVVDSAVTSTPSWVTFHLEERVKYINVPRDYSMWHKEEGLYISEKRFQLMTPGQQQVFLACAAEIQANWVPANFKKDTPELINRYNNAGVELYYMNKEEHDQWADYAKKIAWHKFVESSPRGQELLNLALAAKTKTA
jgi:TRAP-type C4-dicarboxylate transport system substrate-binding protein